MLKSALVAALFAAAVPAAALSQEAAPATPPAPENALRVAATAFGQCISSGVRNLAATVTPEAGAASVLGGCSAERDRLGQAVEGMIAGLPADQQASARTQFETHMGEAETQIAAAVRERAAAASAGAASRD